MSNIKVKLSTILLVMTFLQLIYTVSIAHNWIASMYLLSYEHEDTIFMMHFMTWFIVKAIEDK